MLKEDPMTFSVLFLIVAALLFALSTVPKLSRPWMVGIGLALLACSHLPSLARRID
jgi:hypothetical protein